MTEARRRLLLNALKLFDLALVTAALALSVTLVFARPGLPLADLLSVRIKLANLLLFGATVVAWHVVFSLCGMYGSKRLSTRSREMVEALKATTLCTICLASVTGIFGVSITTPRFIAVFWILSSSCVVVGRAFLRYFLAAIRRRGRNLRHILILGTNARAIEFARAIEARPELGYRILGFVDEEWAHTSEFDKTGRTLACDFSALPEFLRRNVVDEVANYLPLRSSYEHASQVAALCELHGILLRFQTDIFGLKKAHSQTGEFADGYHTTSNAGARDGLPMIVKRLVDIAGSLILLVLLSPLLFFVALAILLTSGAPVFFLQERIGYNKRRFLIYKFRTMVSGAEKMMADLETLNEVSGPVFKIKNDPRITRLGKFLRRTSIDELPQLINVLKGDMSLVGPRPLPVRDYQGFSQDWHRRRFAIRPGLTCLWQVNGRSSVTFEQWMELDLQYMDEWSLWLDLKILARTIPAVLKGSGAA